MSPFRLAVLNLFRRPGPTWIAIISIAAAVACSGVLLKLDLLSQSRFKTLAHEGNSIVGAKAGGIEILLGALNLEAEAPDFLPFHLYDSIRTQETVQFEDGAHTAPGTLVKSAVPFLFFGKFKNYKVIATSDAFINRPIPPESPKFAEGAWAAKTGDIVIGSEVADAVGLHAGDAVPLTLAYPPYSAVANSFHVSGILKPTGKVWDYGLYTSIEDGQKALATATLGEKSIWGTNVLNYFLLYHPPQSLPQLESLINKRTVAQIVPINSALEKLEDLTGTGQSFGLMMTALILFLSACCVSAMMMTRFDAMAVQLGILRALGYQKSEISRWLLWEGLILGAFACVIGGAIDIAIFPWIRGISGLDLPSYIPSPIFQSLWVWLAAMIATMLAVLIPLLRLYRQDVHAALKGN